VPEPGPDSPARSLLGLAAAFRCSDVDDAESGLLGNLDDLILQARLRFRMDQPQQREDVLIVVEFLLLLIQELGCRLLRERRAHAQALQQLRQEAEAGARGRRFRQPAEAPEAPDSGCPSPERGRERGQSQISAIRKAQEERRAALGEAVKRMQSEIEETRAREKQLAEENEVLIRSTAQCEQVIDEYRTEGAILSEHVEGLFAENVDLRFNIAGATPRGTSSLISGATPRGSFGLAAGRKGGKDSAGNLGLGSRPLPMTPKCAVAARTISPGDQCRSRQRRRLFGNGRTGPRGPYITTMRQCLDELSGVDGEQKAE